MLQAERQTRQGFTTMGRAWAMRGSNPRPRACEARSHLPRFCTYRTRQALRGGRHPRQRKEKRTSFAPTVAQTVSKAAGVCRETARG